MNRIVKYAVLVAATGALVQGCGGGGGGNFRLTLDTSGQDFSCKDCAVITKPGRVPAKLSSTGTLSLDLAQVERELSGMQGEPRFRIVVIDANGSVIKASAMYKVSDLKGHEGQQPLYAIGLSDPDEGLLRDEDESWSKGDGTIKQER
jgi:hypothetical protein